MSSAPLIRPHLLSLLEWELIQATANAGNKSSVVYPCRQSHLKRLCAKGDMDNLKTLKQVPYTMFPTALFKTQMSTEKRVDTQWISLTKDCLICALALIDLTKLCSRSKWDMKGDIIPLDESSSSHISGCRQNSGFHGVGPSNGELFTFGKIKLY